MVKNAILLVDVLRLQIMSEGIHDKNIETLRVAHVQHNVQRH